MGLAAATWLGLRFALARAGTGATEQLLPEWKIVTAAAPDPRGRAPPAPGHPWSSGGRSVRHDLARVLAKSVVVALQAHDGHQALDEEAVELDKAAVLGHAQDHGVKVVADAVLHEFDLLPLHQLALGVVGAALRLAGFIGNLGELDFARAAEPVASERWISWPLCLRRLSPVAHHPVPLSPGGQDRLGDAVDDEVRVAADGRSKVRIARRRQRKVAFVLLAVTRLAQRTKHEMGEDALLGLARYLERQLLIHARGYGDIFGDLILARLVAPARAAAPLLAALRLHRHPLYREGPSPSE